MVSYNDWKNSVYNTQGSARTLCLQTFFLVQYLLGRYVLIERHVLLGAKRVVSIGWGERMVRIMSYATTFTEKSL